MRLFDRIKSLFLQSPSPAASRAFAAAKLNRLTDSWRITSEQIDDELRNDLDALRIRARMLENNNDYARRYLDMVETNLIGESAPRLVPLADDAPGSPDTAARRAILASWIEWGQRGICEVSGQYSFADFCRQVVRCVARDGECLVQVVRGAASGNRWGYSLRVLDVGRLCTRLNRLGSNGENAIVCGVETNSVGKPIAYHFNTGMLSAWASGTERVEASNLLHRFVTQRPEQQRGIPWMHAAMLSMHYAGEFALSALMAAKHGADHLGFFVTPDGEPPKIGEEASDEDGSRIATSAPGTWDTLPYGTDVRNIDSRYPNEVFGPFVKSAYQRMSSGLPGASYPELCNDYEAVNFSSIRAAVLSSRDEWRKRQQWMATAILDPIYSEWLASSLSRSAIMFPWGSALPVDKLQKFQAHTWQFRGWSWVDPLKDVETAKEQLALKLTSRSRIASEQGRDIEDIFDELQQEESLAAKYKIDLSPPVAAPKPPMPTQGTTP